jgi:magnesium transporter
LWLTILFFTGLLTAFALQIYQKQINEVPWLAWFIALIVSTGGNSGNQSATLVITALALGEVRPADWWRIVRRELVMGCLLGGFLAVNSYIIVLLFVPEEPISGLVLPVTILLVVVCGTLVGSLLPLLFKRLGLDPALMSNPFVAGIIDIAGIVIYMQCAAAIVVEVKRVVS